MSALPVVHRADLRLVPPPIEEEPVDLDQAVDFVLRLFEKDHSGFAILAFIHPDKPDVLLHESVPLGPKRREICRHLIGQYIADHNCFVGFAKYAREPYWDPKKRRKVAAGEKRTETGGYVYRQEHMVQFARWAICDRDAHSYGQALPPATFTIATSSGSFQDWYELSTLASTTQAKDLNDRIAAASGVGKDAIDSTHVLRIPGTRNLWPRNHREIVRIAEETGAIYTLDDFAHLPSRSNATPGKQESVPDRERGDTVQVQAVQVQLGEAVLARSSPVAPLTPERVREFNRDEGITEVVARFLGMPEDARIGEAFCCILPGHVESRPSAAIVANAQGYHYYHDMHAGKHGSPEILTLAEVYYAQRTGRVVKLGREVMGHEGGKVYAGKPTHAVWRLRLLHDAGLLEPAPVPLRPLEGKVRDVVRDVYVGIHLLFGLRWAAYERSPMPLAHRFVAEWIGLDPESDRARVGRAIQTLFQKGIIEQVGSFPTRWGAKHEVALYLPAGMPKESV